MPQIKVYADTFCRDLHETHDAQIGQSLGQWMAANVKSYDPSVPPRFTASIGGKQLSIDEISNRPMADGEAVEVYVSPADPGSVLATLWTAFQVISVVYTLYTYYKLSKQKSTDPGERGTIYDPNVQANQPRLLGIIPEVFGRHKIFPDIISLPWREYIDGDQYLYLMTCVGVGEFEIDTDEIFISNTPISRYGDDIDYSIFGPGADVTGHPAHRHVYTSPEVGVAADGSSGIELVGSVGSIGELEVASELKWNFLDDTLQYTLDVSEIGVFNALRLGFLGFPPSFTVSEFIQIETDSMVNDGKFRVDAVVGDTLTLTKMLDDLTDVDPTWTGSPPVHFTTQSNVQVLITKLGADGAGGFYGPFLACPLNETTSAFYIDTLFPNGLISIHSGDTSARTVDIEIEWRDAHAGGVWSEQTVSFTSQTLSAIGKTHTFELPTPITPEVRVRRITKQSTDIKNVDDIYWTGLKSELSAAESYPGLTTIALKIKGTNAISGQSENKFNMIVERKLAELSSGVFGGNNPTRRISSAARYIINDIGNTDANIDMEELSRLDDIWQARGDVFDGIFLSDNTFFEALKDVVAPGFTIPVLDFGQISFSRDEARTIYEHMYQPDNTVGGIEREMNLLDDDEPDGMEVDYIDGETWQRNTVTCLLPSDLGANPQQIRAFGITDRTRAWRLGMRKRREREYRRTQFKFSTEMDALNSRFGSFCALGDDMPNYSQTGYIKAVDDQLLTLSQRVVFTSGGVHYIAVRRPDGTLSGPYIATAVDDEPFQVTIDEPLDFTPITDGTQEPPLFQFGVADRWTEPVLIAEIQPQGMESVNVTAVNYDERVYADDDNEPPG